MANHPMTCLTCEADAHCELQRVAHYVGITPDGMKRYRRAVRNIPIDTSNPFFDMDHNKCILCGICVRTCELKAPQFLAAHVLESGAVLLCLGIVKDELNTLQSHLSRCFM